MKYTRITRRVSRSFGSATHKRPDYLRASGLWVAIARHPLSASPKGIGEVIAQHFCVGKISWKVATNRESESAILEPQ